MHIVFVIANESSVPYFNWFAEKSLDQDHYRFSFVALNSSRPKMLEEMKARGLDAYWIPFDSAKRKRGMINSLFKLIRLYIKVQPDVVHSHLFDDSVPALLAARLVGVRKRVITKQDTTFHWFYTRKWVWFDKFNNWNATHIHAVASSNKEFILEKENAPKNKVHLVRNGFPYDLMTASSQEDIDLLKGKYDLEGRIVVGTVARYIHWKGHHHIITAAKALVKSYPKLLFIWAGTDGGHGYKQELEEMIAREGLADHIILLGWIDRAKMPSLYKCMDIYLHPALREPFGFAISEALMNQVPIIATETGSTDLIKHKEEGYLLKIDDPEDVIKGMKWLLENDDRRKRISKAGHAHAVKNLTFENMWEGHIEMYNK